MSFLIAIFCGYILYGLAASLFASVWTSIASDLGVKFTLLGALTMIIYGASGLSSGFAFNLRRKFGTSRSIVLSFLCFAIAMILFYNAKNIFFICIGLAFQGLGAGIVDTVSNSYIVKAYEGGVAALLHASWGLGSTIGPMVMSFAILNTSSYKNGFIWTAVATIVLIIVLLCMKLYWEKVKVNLPKDFVKLHSVSNEEKTSSINMLDVFSIKNGVIFVICFILCGAVNSAASAWVATLAVEQRGVDVTIGAKAATFYFLGTTITRVILGFVSKKIGDKYIIFFGQVMTFIALVLMYFKTSSILFVYIDSALLGIGVAPLVPFLHHSVKNIFEEKYLGLFVSCCNFTSLIGSALISYLIAIEIKLLGIQNAQLILIIFIVLGFISYLKVLQSKNKI